MPELGDVILTLRGSGQTYDEYELQKEFEDGRSLVCRRTTPDIDEQAKVILKLAPGFKMRSALHLAVRITVNYGDRLVVHDQILDRSQVQTATIRGIQLAGLTSLPTPLPVGQKAEHPSYSWTWREGIVCVSVTRGSAGSDRTVQGMSAKTWEAKVKKTQRTPPNGWNTYCPGWTSLASDGQGTMLSFEIRPPGYTSDKALLIKMPSSAAELSATTNPSAERPAHHEDTNGNGLPNGREPNDQPTSLPSTGVRHNTADRTEPATPKRPQPNQVNMGSTSLAKAPLRRTRRPRPEPSVCGNGEQDTYDWDQDQDDEEIKPSILQLSQAAARVVLPGPRESVDQSSVSEPIRTLSDASNARPSVVGAVDSAAGSSVGKRKSTATSDEEDDMDELHDQLKGTQLEKEEKQLERREFEIKRKIRRLNKKVA
ncbi:hypothetical protein LTR56_006213 [Elasticomyces elasticus]|nr:hypothetical protein LTR56_006213 [Elasticomyces elasticus]KAK3666578.1 hypothetical protein LTR22_002522 [Elasticomyces elasticus]KAK4928289.1 hypothetical protein LTR49_004966 [Elasticomyces elasticus]KAK5763852.1 hypothetical protein LTS12_005970 [Elasticomyces elasticus]